jgi:hypothetical protein
MAAAAVDVFGTPPRVRGAPVSYREHYNSDSDSEGAEYVHPAAKAKEARAEEARDRADAKAKAKEARAEEAADAKAKAKEARAKQAAARAEVVKKARKKARTATKKVERLQRQANKIKKPDTATEFYVMWKNKWLPRLRKRAAAMVSYCDMTREGESRSGGLKIDEPVLEYISTAWYAEGRRIERVNVVSIIRQEIGRQPYTAPAAGAAPLESEELVEELYQADSEAFGEAMFDALLHGDDNTQYYPDWVGICRSAFMGDTGHIYGNCEMWVDFMG